MDILIIENRYEKFEQYSRLIKDIFKCNITHHTDLENTITDLQHNYRNLIILSGKMFKNNDNFLQKIQDTLINDNCSIIVITEDNYKYKKLSNNCYYIQESEISGKNFTKIMHDSAIKSLLPKSNKKALNILFIEDDKGDYKLYTRNLNSMFKCKLVHYSSAEQALKALKVKKFDLILLDYNLPSMNGIEFLQNLKIIHTNLPCPIVVITGQSNVDVTAEIMKLGINEYINKDNISQKSLSKAIYSAIHQFSYSKLQNEKQSELFLFAHTVSHDLKAPLGRIKSYANLLKANKNNNIDRYIANITEDTEYAVNFLNNLMIFLELGRSPIKKTEIDLNEVLNQSIRNLEIDISNRKAKIIVEKLPIIYGDKICLVQLFQNLISNSLKYCKRKPVIKISLERKNNIYVINIIDNGIGIIKKMLKKIFQPFTRAENEMNSSGVGLGLALCNLIAKQHHAKISAMSEKKGGTRFSISIPQESWVKT